MWILYQLTKSSIITLNLKVNPVQTTTLNEVMRLKLTQLALQLTQRQVFMWL